MGHDIVEEGSGDGGSRWSADLPLGRRLGGSGGGHGSSEAVVDGHPALFEELLLEGADGQRVHDGHDEKGQVEGNDRGRDDEGRGLWAASFVEEVVLVRGVEHGEDEERSGDAE